MVAGPLRTRARDRRAAHGPPSGTGGWTLTRRFAGRDTRGFPCPAELRRRARTAGAAMRMSAVVLTAGSLLAAWFSIRILSPTLRVERWLSAGLSVPVAAGLLSLIAFLSTILAIPWAT